MDRLNDLDHIRWLEQHETRSILCQAKAFHIGNFKRPGVSQKQNERPKGRSTVKDENLFRRHFLRDRGLRIRANARPAIEGTSITVGMMPS